MIVTKPTEFVQAFSALPARFEQAVPQAVFLVAPHRFALEAESARDNVYMRMDALVDPERAAAQHTALVGAIAALGIPVVVFPGIEEQRDGLFPNNVFATTEDRFIVGAMRHPARQAEARREDVRSHFARGGRRLIDLSAQDCVAELTGPLVIDRARRVGLCGTTPRVDEAGLRAMHEAFDLALTFRFALVETEYHTNVVLSVLAGRACVIHRESFSDPAVARAIERAYEGATIVIDDAEKAAFAGNCIALTKRDVFLSKTADSALRPATRARFAALGFALHAIAVDEIEKAGGSVRCMIGEVF